MDLVRPFYVRSSSIEVSLLSFVVGRLSSRHEFVLVLHFAIRSSSMSSTSLTIATWLLACVLSGAALQLFIFNKNISGFHGCSSRFTTVYLHHMTTIYGLTEVYFILHCSRYSSSVVGRLARLSSHHGNRHLCFVLQSSAIGNFSHWYLVFIIGYL